MGTGGMVSLIVMLLCMLQFLSATNTSSFSTMLGSTLYGWEQGKTALLAESTNTLLADVEMLGLYYSASWCAPCRRFTPELVDFYETVRARTNKFQIVLVSADQSEEDFVRYFHKMPWLAVPLEAVEEVNRETAVKFKVKGIPHLVFLKRSRGSGPDGQDDWSVISLDGVDCVKKNPFSLPGTSLTSSVMKLVPSFLQVWVKARVTAVRGRLSSVGRGLLAEMVPDKMAKRAIRVISAVWALSRVVAESLWKRIQTWRGTKTV